MEENKNSQPVNEKANMLNSWIDRITAKLSEIAFDIAAGHYPWLNFFPIKQIAQWFVARKTRELSKYIKQRVTEGVIDSQIKEEVADAVEARDQLKTALAEGDPDAIQKASDEFDKKYAELIRHNGHSTNVN